MTPEREEHVPQREVSFRPRAILQAVGVLLGVAALLWILYLARQVITWVFVALFLTLALNPAVSAMEKRGLRRGLATGVVFLTLLLGLGAVGGLLIPPLVDQVGGLAEAAPGYVEDLTKGRGPLGFLERDYHVVEKLQEAQSAGGATKLAGGATAVLSLTKSVLTVILGFVTIVFLTIFMLLEGPQWWERMLGLMSPEHRPRWRNVGHQIGRTVSGYVTGNLLLSVMAGSASAIVLLLAGVPFPIALGLLVAILDLIPLAGATLAGIMLGVVALLTSVSAGIVVVTFFTLYQQLENHVLQPLVYGRTVQLSPLVVLIAILIGSAVAGVLGALAAIPVAGTLQILLVDWLRHRRRLAGEDDPPAAIAAERLEPDVIEEPAPG
jgi:predicted PurR-regulated permease PerM